MELESCVAQQDREAGRLEGREAKRVLGAGGPETRVECDVEEERRRRFEDEDRGKKKQKVVKFTGFEETGWRDGNVQSSLGPVRQRLVGVTANGKARGIVNLNS